ncbi:MAG: glycoside hydrolase family 32 protein [Gammaproteobacteria bacterium]|nr:glycoside hydrolase family 32 protein [Gammaproteobacteria bacterium]
MLERQRIGLALLGIAAAVATLPAGAQATYDEPWRPQFHFSQPENFMNDPNGLVYYKGEYHLFYQYRCYESSCPAVGVSWGHAVSRDLLHWEHLPVAIPALGVEQVYSGSAVFDAWNTSGCGTVDDPPLVAVYTNAYTDPAVGAFGVQVQSIAASMDGRTLARYQYNPVLIEPRPDFRDPKVFWHAPSRRWIMAVAKPYDARVGLYSSPDLKSWTHQSDFGPLGATGTYPIRIWEVPDLFPLAVDGDPLDRRWVMVVSAIGQYHELGMGTVVGGGTQAFVGDFDGTRFVAEDRAEYATPSADWLDWGKDNYAGITFDNVPDGRRVFIGWVNNWEYAQQVPTSPWQGQQSVPRELTLRMIDGVARLVARPIAELAGLREGPVHSSGGGRVEGTRRLDVLGREFDIEAEFALGGAAQFGLRVLVGEGERTAIGYDVASGRVFIDRTQSGTAGTALSAFAGVHSAPLPARGGKVRLRILVDRSVVEVFANDGERVLTDLVYPGSESQGLELFALDGDVRLQSLNVWRMRSVWGGAPAQIPASPADTPPLPIACDAASAPVPPADGGSKSQPRVLGQGGAIDRRTLLAMLLALALAPGLRWTRKRAESRP